MSKKLVLEIQLEDQLEEIYWEMENIKNQMSFLRRVSEVEDNSELESLHQDEYNQGRSNILESLEEKIKTAKSNLWQIIENERGQNEK